MGTSFLPYAGGHALAGWLSGDLYEKTSDKIYLLQQEVARRNLSIPEISESFSKNDFFNEAAAKMVMTKQELTNFIWTEYQPSKIWYIYSGVAVLAVVLLWLYNRFIIKN